MTKAKKKKKVASLWASIIILKYESWNPYYVQKESSF